MSWLLLCLGGGCVGPTKLIVIVAVLFITGFLVAFITTFWLFSVAIGSKRRFSIGVLKNGGALTSMTVTMMTTLMKSLARVASGLNW